MSLEEFRRYVESSGETLEGMSREDKIAWRESFEKTRSDGVGSTQQQHVVSAAVVSEEHITKGQLIQPQEDVSPYGQQSNPMLRQHQQQHDASSSVQLRNIPLDNTGSHIPMYDPKNGGYVTYSGSMSNSQREGNFSDHGMSGPGVNETVKSTGDVAYGGAYGSQYEGDYYSAKRVVAPVVLQSSAPIAQTVEVKVSTTGNIKNTSGEFDYDSVRAQYGNGYTAKKI